MLIEENTRPGFLDYRWEWGLIFLLVGLGFWLRIRNLGNLSFYGDEDLTALAVRAIQEDGYPHMPSGMNYSRAILFSYLVTGFVSWFGTSEWAFRFPSVIFGTASILVFHLIGRQWIGRRPALLATALFTFSSFHIVFSRVGRMYAPFLFFVLLSIFFCMRGLNGRKQISRVFFCIFALISVHLHTIGIVLVSIMFFPLLVRSWPRKESLLLAGLGTITIIFVGIQSKISEILFLPKMNNMFHSRSTISTKGMQNILDLIGFSNLDYFPKFRVFSHMLQFSPFLLGGLLILILVSLAGAFYFGVSRFEWTVLLLLELFGFFNLFGLVFVLIISVTFIYSPFPGSKSERPLFLIMAATLGFLFLVWTGYGMGVWLGEGLAGVGLIKKAIKESIFFPAWHIIMFLRTFPLMSVLVLLGSGILFYRHCKGGLPFKKGILFIAFWLPLVGLGFAREYVSMRYLLPVYPFFLLILSVVVWDVYRYIAGNFLKMKSIEFVWIWVIGFIIVFPGFAVDHSFSAALRISNGDPTQRVPSQVNYGFPIFPDHRGAGIFVKKFLKAGENVVAMDATAQKYYSGKVDYWLRTWSDARVFSVKDGSVYRDRYTGAEVISEVSGLEDIICTGETGTWIITSGEFVESPDAFIPEGVDEFLGKHFESRRWTGQDGITEVYYFPPRSCRNF